MGEILKTIKLQVFIIITPIHYGRSPTEIKLNGASRSMKLDHPMNLEHGKCHILPCNLDGNVMKSGKPLTFADAVGLHHAQTACEIAAVAVAVVLAVWSSSIWCHLVLSHTEYG